MGLKPSRSRRLTVILVVSLLSPLVFFSYRLSPWESSNRFATVWQDLLYPLEYVWESATDLVTTTWTNYFDLHNAAKENQKLRTEISLLRTRAIDYEEHVLEIDRLRALLGFTKRFDKKLLVAEVIGAGRIAAFEAIRITRGDLDGVKVGMPVVTPDGIVGRVVRTGLKFSDIQLLTDANFNLDVLLQRTRVRGVLRGVSANRCLLSLHRQAEIRIGDTITTSGIVGGFPKGLPVGRVMRISYESDNISQIITVEPWVDFRRVEEVVILYEADKELEKIIETAGRDWIDKTIKNSEGG